MTPSPNGQPKSSPRPSVKEEQRRFEREHKRNIEELDRAMEKLDKAVEQKTAKSQKTPA